MPTSSVVSCQLRARSVSAWTLSTMRLMLFFDGRWPKRALPVVGEYIRPNVYPRKSNSPSGTLQIRVFSSFTVSFSLPMISRRLSGWLDEQGRTWLQRRLALEDTRREHLSPGSALASLTDYRVLARVVMVDRRDRPGGHWNDAYPFVGLHQPAAFYGVASRELSEWKKDETGLNAGFYSLSTGTEVLNHFEQVMRQRFLPSGRVVFHPMTEYSEESGSHRL